MLISIIILLGFMFIGFPIYIALLASSFYLLFFELSMSIQSVMLVLYDSVARFTLAAVPFFLLTGAILENSTMGERLVEWMYRVVGKIRGGLPLTGILANEFFGAISGSSAAATATVGKILHPKISKVESESFSIGLLTSAGALSVIMPPSITMILYGATASISISDLFLTGIVPALIVGVVIGGFIIVRSKGELEVDAEVAAAAEATYLQNLGRATKNAFWVILFPLIILGGIYSGWFTPTEAAAFSAIYALMVAVFIYRDMGFKSLFQSVKSSLELTMQIFIVIAASAVFSQAMTFAQIPQQLVALTEDMPAFYFLIVLNILLILVGMFFDPTSAILVLTPLIVPIAQNLGIDLIHLGLIMTMNIAIGMFTPPFGLNLFVSQGVFQKPMHEIVNSLRPFWVWYGLCLLIVTYWPQLFMWIPEAFSK
ncbi:TRAP transporter large permease [Bacillus canaveralius]|uniref:TRAP transporter large permease n=1 Tax=Bacillus canaveralius TaxID=1403243 RepID=UPI000F78ACCE|nr:TRAP transporter large permease subunit [Bacillus canaveralius]RSK55134.1 TRAP transporter large permease subunit [Bacillus canaveralius]